MQDSFVLWRWKFLILSQNAQKYFKAGRFKYDNKEESSLNVFI